MSVGGDRTSPIVIKDGQPSAHRQMGRVARYLCRPRRFNLLCGAELDSSEAALDELPIGLSDGQAILRGG